MPIPSDPKKRKYMFTDDIKFLQKAIIFHPSENKFLTLKRPDNAFSRPKCWDLVGGNVLFGKSHFDSLVEEIKEETSLQVENIKPIQVTTRYDNNKKIYYIFIGYTCKSITSKIKISKEHSEYKWVTKQEFSKLESADFLIKFVKELD